MIDYDKFLNSNLVSVKPSGIRRFFAIAEELKKPITLGVGEPDFETPFHIRQKAIESLMKGKTKYTSNSGLTELREEVCRFYKRKYNIEYDAKTESLITVGGSEGIDAAIRAIVEPGDEVIVVEPSFVCYKPIVQVCCGVPKVIETKKENEFKLTAQELRAAISDKTKMLVLPFPNNPTGAILTKEELEELASVIIENDILVLSDEIYSELTYTKEGHTSIASLPGMKERCIVINGFSKTYSMTGWRLGYALAPEPIIAQMTKMHQFGIMSAPTTSQYAAIEALRHGDKDIENMKSQYDMRRRLVVDGFNKIGLECFEPKGAFYAFPCIKSTGLSSEEFCERLIRAKNVVVVPGNAFGESGEGYIRVSYCSKIEDIKKAIRLIGEFINEIKDNG